MRWCEATNERERKTTDNKIVINIWHGLAWNGLGGNYFVMTIIRRWWLMAIIIMMNNDTMPLSTTVAMAHRFSPLLTLRDRDETIYTEEKTKCLRRSSRILSKWSFKYIETVFSSNTAIFAFNFKLKNKHLVKSAIDWLLLWTCLPPEMRDGKNRLKIHDPNESSLAHSVIIGWESAASRERANEKINNN